MELDYVKLKEIKPVLTGYIRKSQILLRNTTPPDEAVIHDVRVLMKKSRASLKLVAPQLDKEYVTRDIVALRGVGRKMCSWRESSVLRKTLKGMRKEFPDLFAKLADNETINRILKKPSAETEIQEAINTDLDEIQDLLNKAAFRIRFLSMAKLNPELLIKELDLTYVKVTDIFLKCRNNPKSGNLHELRKRTKDFLYQLLFFRPLNPSVIKALEKKLDAMTQCLGRYNDLAQLITALDYKYIINRNVPAIDELVIRIREKQDSNLSKVWQAAYKIFCPGQKLVNILGFKLLVI
jgi:CHAD domain-containing protein